jgi:hypothetical protein
MRGLDCIAALKALDEETRLRILLRLLFRKPMKSESSDPSRRPVCKRFACRVRVRQLETTKLNA